MVFNLAAETRQNQETSVHEARCTTLSTLCATMAQKTGIPRFIEVSTAAVYKSQNSSPAKETSSIAPGGRLASAKRAAEVALHSMTDLKPIIVRPAMVYGGTGDSNGVVFGRMICASVYSPPAEGHSYEALSDASKGKKHKMTLLWDGGLKINTVHVVDVCRGLWAIYLRAPLGSTWNLCDKNDTDQAKVTKRELSMHTTCIIIINIICLYTIFRIPLCSCVGLWRRYSTSTSTSTAASCQT